MTIWSTKEVARLLGISVTKLQRAVWDGRLDPPQKTPAGNFLWTPHDVERASWVLLHKAFEMSPGLAMSTQ